MAEDGLLLPFLITAWCVSSVHVRTVSRLLPQRAAPTTAPLATSELRPGLEMTFPRPASQRTWPPKVCCLHARCHGSLCGPVPQGPPCLYACAAAPPAADGPYSAALWKIVSCLSSDYQPALIWENKAEFSAT